MFAIKPKVDWAKLRETYRPRAAAAKTNHELATIISEMLDHLEDLHVYVAGRRRDHARLQPPPPAQRQSQRPARPDRTDHLDGPRLWTGDAPPTASATSTSSGCRTPPCRKRSTTCSARWPTREGLILDLRYNGGGSEPLGCQIAGRLLDRRRVYSLSQYRNGPKHTDLGPKHERTCGPAGPWHYAGPVVVLQGRKTMSSAESFALALAQCPQVTTLGDRTAGSSGNPRRVDAGAGIVVNLPRWIDMDPEGKPIDAVGRRPSGEDRRQAGGFSTATATRCCRRRWRICGVAPSRRRRRPAACCKLGPASK